MKSITSRIQEITDIGKVEEDGTTFSNVAKALNSIGIAAVDAQGQLRPLQEILDELGPMWATLDRNHQAYIATVLAGNRLEIKILARDIKVGGLRHLGKNKINLLNCGNLLRA